MGDALADEVQRVLTENNLSVDVVIPVSSARLYSLLSRRSHYSCPRSLIHLESRL